MQSSSLGSHSLSPSITLQASPQFLDLKLFNDNQPAIGHDGKQAEVSVKIELIQQGCRQYVEIVKPEGSLPLAYLIPGNVFERYQLSTYACVRARMSLHTLTRHW